MSTTFRRYAPDQSLLLPPDVREWLPEGTGKVDALLRAADETDVAEDVRLGPEVRGDAGGVTAAGGPFGGDPSGEGSVGGGAAGGRRRAGSGAGPDAEPERGAAQAGVWRA